MKIDRNKVYQKYDGHCAYCGEIINIKDMQVDHLIPKANYFHYVKNKYKIPDFLKHLGEWDCDHIDNLMPACRSCNNYKSTFDLELFRHELGQLVKRMNKTITIYRIAKRYGQVIEDETSIVFYFEIKRRESLE